MTSNGIRVTFFSAAALSTVASVVLGLHRAAANPWQHAPTKLTIAATPALPSLERAILRDPFDAPAVAPRNGVVGFAPPNGVLPINGPGTPSGGMLVPNPGQPIQPGNTSPEVIQLIGTLLGGGRDPAALVLIGQQTQVLRIGDTLAGHRIAEILSQGIIFSDGGRLAIATGPSLPQNGSVPQPNVTPSPIPMPTEAPTASPLPLPTISSTPPAYYRPLTIPQPFNSPPAGPPPTIGPPPPPSMNVNNTFAPPPL